MTLTTLLIYVAIAAVVLTLITIYVFRSQKTLWMSFMQNYVGALFIFSGWVKAVDPLGMAYKITDYFAEFEATFEPTWFGFLAPLFPFLSEYAVGVSVFVIVFEIMLGIMLITGHKSKFTAWAFILMVGFFTFLTGFTYLTGYVPGDANFFSFGDWTAYDKNNMKVTDCGCFGDFIKLEPKISFFKDVVLLVPAVLFITGRQHMHKWFNRTTRNILISLSVAGLILYCLSNYMWDIPHADFRPFKKERNIAEQKMLEEEAQANVQILSYSIENKTSGEKLELPYAEYLKRFQEFPSTDWNLEQNYSEPAIASSKLSEFEISDLEGYSLNDKILANEDPILFLVAHKLYGSGEQSTRIVTDTIFKIDTIQTPNGGFTLQRNIKSIDETTQSYTDYVWDEFYADRYKNVILDLVESAKSQGIETIMAVGGASPEQIEDFRSDINLDITYGTADDILLKTIVRSNPGILLMKDGVILNKWHYTKVPGFDEIQSSHLR